MRKIRHAATVGVDANLTTAIANTMCGRFVQFSPTRVYARMFSILEHADERRPSFNIAPSQELLAVRTGDRGGRELVPLRWGVIPSWSKGPDSRFNMINARAETVASKPAYRAAFRYRRCIVPSEGFYEWALRGAAKQPFFIRMRDAEPFALAGLWEHWQDASGKRIESCAIIVTEANTTLAQIHDRMPVILPRRHWDAWLNPRQQDAAQLQPLLQPFPSAGMVFHAVSRRVNSPRNEGPDLIAPLSAAD